MLLLIQAIPGTERQKTDAFSVSPSVDTGSVLSTSPCCPVLLLIFVSKFCPVKSFANYLRDFDFTSRLLHCQGSILVKFVPTWPFCEACFSAQRGEILHALPTPVKACLTISYGFPKSPHPGPRGAGEGHSRSSAVHLGCGTP
jgi:hypothetical protein